MKKTRSNADLMPASAFLEFFTYIEEEAKILFEVRSNKDKKMDKKTYELLQKSLLDRIRAIEKDIHNSLLSAWSKETAEMLSREFYSHSSEVSYLIHHDVVNEIKFKYYFKKFKEEATIIKLEAIDAMLDGLRYANSKGGKTAKAPKGICALIGGLVREDPEISAINVWNKIKSAILSQPDKTLFLTLQSTSHALTYDSKTQTLFDFDDETGQKRSSKLSGGFKDHVSEAKKYFQGKKPRSK